MTDRLTFDEPSHIYKWDGRVVPSVTQVLQPLTKLWTNGADLERARQEGKAHHSLVELECKGELDEDNLAEWLRPLLGKWRKFVADNGFVMRSSEKMHYSETYGYAGTPDLDGTLTKVKGQPEAVIDLKRTLSGKIVGLQLAAYEKLLCEETPLTGKRRRFGLQLNPLRFLEYDNPRDWTDFLCALAWHQLNKRLNPSSTGAHYRMQKDGHNMLCTADGKRSVFDDVDE